MLLVKRAIETPGDNAGVWRLENVVMIAAHGDPCEVAGSMSFPSERWSR